VRRLGARRREGRPRRRLRDVDAPRHARAEGADARVGRRGEARDRVRVYGERVRLGSAREAWRD
jgi:hypothetical protein